MDAVAIAELYKAELNKWLGGEIKYPVFGEWFARLMVNAFIAESASDWFEAQGIRQQPDGQ